MPPCCCASSPTAQNAPKDFGVGVNATGTGLHLMVYLHPAPQRRTASRPRAGLPYLRPHRYDPRKWACSHVMSHVGTSNAMMLREVALALLAVKRRPRWSTP